MDPTRYIVLFRGVGGATQLPVKRLKAVLDDAGFEDVATYINSGNAVLTASLDEAGVVEAVGEAVRREMGFDKAVMARGADDWDRMITGNPFVQAADDPTRVHVYALEAAPQPEDVEALEAKASGTERFHLNGRTLYLHTPDGMGTSRFAPKIEPTLKVAMTARNWRSMLALQKLARSG